MRVRTAHPEDLEAWLRRRLALWPDGSEAEHREEIRPYFRGERPRGPWAVLLAEGSGERILGFAEVSVRPYAEGCLGSKVAYLEGWYVVPEARGQGVGRALVAAAETWGREQGCRELASDTEPENDVSTAAHLALGFEDVGLVRCFRKELGDGDRSPG